MRCAQAKRGRSGLPIKLSRANNLLYYVLNSLTVIMDLLRAVNQSRRNLWLMFEGIVVVMETFIFSG